jgi:hypothetical protein
MVMDEVTVKRRLKKSKSTLNRRLEKTSNSLVLKLVHKPASEAAKRHCINRNASMERARMNQAQGYAKTIRTATAAKEKKPKR